MFLRLVRMNAKKSILPVLLIGGGGFLVWYASRKLKAIDKLQFLPVNFSITGKFPTYKVNLLMQITNPTSVPLSVSSIFADVLQNGKRVGKIALDKSFNISPKKDNLITIPVDIYTGQFIATIISMIANKEKINLTIKGIINSEGSDINIDQEIPLSA